MESMGIQHCTPFRYAVSRLYRLYARHSQDHHAAMTLSPSSNQSVPTSLVRPTPTNAPQAVQAPLQIEFRLRLNLPPTEAFELVTVRLGEWFTAIHAVTWNHSKSTRGVDTLGACSERVCNFDGKALVEKIVEFEPGRSYAYSADMQRSEMKMPLRDHLGRFEVVPDAIGSVVIWRQYFRPQWFVPAALLRWQMRDKMMRPALAVLIRKYGGEWIYVR
jgi:hypothetical protein